MRVAGASAGRSDGNPGSVASARNFFLYDVRAAAVIGAAIVLLAGAALSAALNIWVDESFTLHTTGAGPRQAWAQSIAFEAQPPLFFVLEAIWRTLDETSITFARLPSIVFAAAAVAVIVYAGHRIAPRIPPLAVALVTALNPLIIWAAVEMRVYALVLLIGALLTWTFYEGFLVSRPQRSARIWYTLFAIAGLYTQYYVAFLLVAQGVTLLAVRRSEVRAFAAAGVIVALGFLPYLSVALMDARASGNFVTHVTLLHAVHEIADAVFVILLPHDVWSGAAKVLGFGAAGALVFGLCLFGRPARPREPILGVIVAWFCCLAIFALVFTAGGTPLALLKYMIVIVPSSLLVSFAFVASLQRMPAAAGTLALVVYVSYAMTALWSQYRPPLMKFGDWQRVAGIVRAGDPSTPIVVFPAELAQPLHWYLPPSTSVVEIPGPMRFTIDYVRESSLVSEFEVARALDPLSAHDKRFWLVTIDDCRGPNTGPYNYHCGYLEEYLSRRYRVVRSVPFHGALARLYVRLANSSADRHNEVQ